MTTSGYCRYRQAIPSGPGGRLDTDSNYGIRKSFLPQVNKVTLSYNTSKVGLLFFILSIIYVI